MISINEPIEKIIYLD